uniref:Uncharacterized protein n=1 Tax=Arundo donax TaxID=35708 RepID=A0A0A9DDA4_ARUDO
MIPIVYSLRSPEGFSVLTVEVGCGKLYQGHSHQVSGSTGSTLEKNRGRRGYTSLGRQFVTRVDDPEYSGSMTPGQR